MLVACFLVKCSSANSLLFTLSSRACTYLIRLLIYNLSSYIRHLSETKRPKKMTSQKTPALRTLTAFLTLRDIVRSEEMRIYFAMALCVWRDDWPPRSDVVRLSVFQTHNELIDFTTPFTCRHPPEGPEELQCYTTINSTHSECVHYSYELRDIPSGTIKIQAADTSRESFSLCRLDLHCSIHPRRAEIGSPLSH